MLITTSNLKRSTHERHFWILSHVQSKGFTDREIRESMEAALEQTVPAAFKDRYDTYAEYQEALHDFLNGL